MEVAIDEACAYYRQAPADGERSALGNGDYQNHRRTERIGDVAIKSAVPRWRNSPSSTSRCW